MADNWNGTITVGGSECQYVRDLTTNIERAENDASSRAGNGFTTTATGLCSVSAEFDMVATAGDSSYSALRAAIIANTAVAVVLTDALAAAISVSMKVARLNKAEPLSSPLMYNARLVGQGEPTFS